MTNTETVRRIQALYDVWMEKEVSSETDILLSEISAVMVGMYNPITGKWRTEPRRPYKPRADTSYRREELEKMLSEKVGFKEAAKRLMLEPDSLYRWLDRNGHYDLLDALKDKDKAS